MEDRKNSDNAEASTTEGLKTSPKTAPSSITVNVRPRREYDDIQVQKSREIPKGLLAVLISVGALLVVGIVVVGVLLLTQPSTPVSADSLPTASQTAEPEATATPEPTQAATPVPTTEPQESDDISAIFEAPTNSILEESQNQ